MLELANDCELYEIERILVAKLRLSDTKVFKQLASMDWLVGGVGNGSVKITTNMALLTHGISIGIDVSLDLVNSYLKQHAPNMHATYLEFMLAMKESKVLGNLQNEMVQIYLSEVLDWINENSLFKHHWRSILRDQVLQYIFIRWLFAFLVGFINGVTITLTKLLVENIAGYKLLVVVKYIDQERYMTGFIVMTGANFLTLVAKMEGYNFIDASGVALSMYTIGKFVSSFAESSMNTAY